MSQVYFVAMVQGTDEVMCAMGVEPAIAEHVASMAGHVPITAEQYQVMHTASTKMRLVDGELVPVAPPPPTEGQIRSRRDQLLSASDWMVMGDVPATDELKSARLAYRQALRDVTAQPGFPNDINWPKAP